MMFVQWRISESSVLITFVSDSKKEGENEWEGNDHGFYRGTCRKRPAVTFQNAVRILVRTAKIQAPPERKSESISLS
jgi:hypothetical protein